jgi:hypothetical protein
LCINNYNIFQNELRFNQVFILICEIKIKIIKENIANFTANREAISSLQEERPDLVNILNNKSQYSTTQVEEAKRELANRVTKYNGIADANVRLVLKTNYLNPKWQFILKDI